MNCGAIPTDLMESELFGHKRGSFTGAVSDKRGLIQSAEGGTLFLDEIADLPLHMQVKLLRVIQEKSVRPVGEQLEVPVDVRILSATHKNLPRLVAEGAPAPLHCTVPMVPAEHLLGECMAKAKSFRCITEANAWRMRSWPVETHSECKANAWPPLCSALLCHLWSWRGFVYAHVRYGALALDDYELLWDSISEDKAKDDEQAKGFSRQIHPGISP